MLIDTTYKAWEVWILLIYTIISDSMKRVAKEKCKKKTARNHGVLGSND